MANPELKANTRVLVNTSPIMTAERLLGQPILEPKNIAIGKPPTNLGRKPMMTIEEQTTNGISVYTSAIRAQVSSLIQNQLYWEIAPGKSFGLDLEDIISDHGRMLKNESQDQSILEKHKKAGRAWKVWKHYGGKQLEAIKSYRTPDIYLLPLIRWTRQTDSEGITTREFIYSPRLQSQEAKGKLANFLITSLKDRVLEDVCDPVLGLYILALFSPEQREWPSYSRLYPEGDLRSIGSTQAPLYTLMRERDLLKSPFLAAAEASVRRM